MARIKLKFYDKEYTIEYANRIEVKEYFAQLEKVYSKDELSKIENVNDEEFYEKGMKMLVILLKAGLVEHHKNEMPSDKDLERWATSIPNIKEFYQYLTKMLQDVIQVIEQDTKNLKWEVEA